MFVRAIRRMPSCLVRWPLVLRTFRSYADVRNLLTEVEIVLRQVVAGRRAVPSANECRALAEKLGMLRT